MATPTLISLLFLFTGCLCSQQTASMKSSSTPAGSEPYLGSYDVQDTCQYNLCGPDFNGEFAGGKPVVGSCSGDCDALVHKMVNSKFKKEFMWRKCTDMCGEKYPIKEYG